MNLGIFISVGLFRCLYRRRFRPCSILSVPWWTREPALEVQHGKFALSSWKHPILKGKYPKTAFVTLCLCLMESNWTNISVVIFSCNLLVRCVMGCNGQQITLPYLQLFPVLYSKRRYASFRRVNLLSISEILIFSLREQFFTGNVSFTFRWSVTSHQAVTVMTSRGAAAYQSWQEKFFWPNFMQK